MTLTIDKITGEKTIREPAKAIVEKGTDFKISEGETKNISSFDLWDPLSDNGRFIAFWMGFSDGTAAIVRLN
jgi:hypothetical protein